MEQPPRRNILRRIAKRAPDLPLAAEAVIWLWLAWLALGMLPFRLVAGMLRPRVRTTGVPVSQYDRDRVVWAVGAAAARVPWRAVCFHEGIAAQRMLARRGIASDLHYGVAKDETGRYPAHVWVAVGRETIVGGGNLENYARLATFSAR